MNKPVNRPVDNRSANHWPTGAAKARWRRQNRAKIARKAQQERDREANNTT